MKYNKIFFFLSLILLTLSNHCMDPKGQKELNYKFINAVKMENLIEVETFFAQGAQIDSKDRLGFTGLMIVATNGNEEIFNFLIKNNANVNEINNAPAGHN